VRVRFSQRDSYQAIAATTGVGSTNPECSGAAIPARLEALGAPCRLAADDSGREASPGTGTIRDDAICIGKAALQHGMAARVLMLKGSLRSGRMGLYRSTGLQRRRHGKSSCHGSPRAQLPLRRLLVKLVACPLHRIRLGGRMRIGDTYCRREHPDLASKRWPKSGPGYKGAPPF
jgi:hypothetical protein